MSVDKFGRHGDSFNKGVPLRGPKGEGFHLTDSGDYDIKKKKLCNVGMPLESDDAATKLYVDDKTPDHDEESWKFRYIRLSNVADALYDGEAVNLRTMRMMCLTKDISTNDHSKNFYHAQNRRITHLSNAVKKNDAVNLEDLRNGCDKVQKECNQFFAASIEGLNQRMDSLKDELTTLVSSLRSELEKDITKVRASLFDHVHDKRSHISLDEAFKKPVVLDVQRRPY